MNTALMTATPPDLALPIRVGIVEDDLRVNQSLAAAVNLADGMEMVWSETTRAAALSALARRPVDVLLVDLGLPDGSGIDVIREAHERLPNCDVMVCTIFGDEAHVLQSIEAGAHGYLLKDSPSGTIAEEIRLLRAGGSPISPLIARLVLGRLDIQRDWGWAPDYVDAMARMLKQSEPDDYVVSMASTYPAGQDMIRPLDNPIKKDSHLVILRGNLASDGAVAKITGIPPHELRPDLAKLFSPGAAA